MPFLTTFQRESEEEGCGPLWKTKRWQEVVVRSIRKGLRPEVTLPAREAFRIGFSIADPVRPHFFFVFGFAMGLPRAMGSSTLSRSLPDSTVMSVVPMYLLSAVAWSL